MDREYLLGLISETIDRIVRPHPVRVAVDGVDASGKTTMASELSVLLQNMGREVIQASIDGFHNPRVIRYRRGERSPESYFHDSFNYRALCDRLLDPLGPGGNRRIQRAIFNYKSDQVVDTTIELVSKNAILLFDGIFLQRPEISRCWDFSIFVEAAFETTLERAIRRYKETHEIDGQGAWKDELRDRYLVRYIPAQRIYLESCHPREVADVVIDNNRLDDPLVIKGGA